MGTKYPCPPLKWKKLQSPWRNIICKAAKRLLHITQPCVPHKLKLLHIVQANVIHHTCQNNYFADCCCCLICLLLFTGSSCLAHEVNLCTYYYIMWHLSFWKVCNTAEIRINDVTFVLNDDLEKNINSTEIKSHKKLHVHVKHKNKNFNCPFYLAHWYYYSIITDAFILS